MLLLLANLISADLDAVLDNPKLAGSVISCTVADASGQVLFQRNPSLRLMPASNQKLLSNAFALYRLGPDYRPQTRIWNLRDRIVLDSPGDPLMSRERLAKAAGELHLDHRKPVYVHEAYRPLIGPSWEWDDLPNKYAAPVCALTVDRGAIELWAQGEKLWIEPNGYWLKPRRGEKGGSRKVTYDPVRRSLEVSGELPATRTRLDTLALDQPDEAAASLLGRGFKLTDSVPTTPPDLVLTGPPLKEAMKECLVHSDNNIAENLFLMAAGVGKPLGVNPYAAADEELKRFLTTTVGAKEGDFRPDDGSGMSRHNLVTTRGIVSVLNWASSQATRSIWLDALVKPGSGTLSERLKGVPFIGKTGTLDGVVALSGYVQTNKGRTLTVSLILNHFTCGEKDARAVTDDFIQKLVVDDGFGTVPADQGYREDRSADPRPLDFDADWHRRPGVHGVDACSRADHRVESADAILHRP